MDLHTAHAIALDRDRRIVDGIVPAQLSLRTPCEGFDVETLLGHLVVGNHASRRWPAALRRSRSPWSPEPTDDWSKAYGASATAVGEAWRDPAALERMAELPMATVPGVVALGMHVVETLVHGWDLAMATGQRSEIAVCAVAWDSTRSVTEELRGPGGPFGPAVAVPEDASPTDRLVAWLGRRP